MVGVFFIAYTFSWNPTMKQLRADELFEKLDPSIYESIHQSLLMFHQAEGMILFSNHDLGHSEVGHCFVIAFGPTNTITSLKVVDENGGRSPVSPPGGGFAWRYYADGWCPRLEMLSFLDSTATRLQIEANRAENKQISD